MSTIDARREQCGRRTLPVGNLPSHPHIVRRTLSYASVGPSGSVAANGSAFGPRHRVGAAGSVECDPSGVVVNGLPDHPYDGSALLDPRTRWRASRCTPLVIAAIAHGRHGRWIHDCHNRRIAAEHLFRTVRLQRYPGGALRRSIAGSPERRSRCPSRCRYRSCAWAWSLGPRKSPCRSGPTKTGSSSLARLKQCPHRPEFAYSPIPYSRSSRVPQLFSVIPPSPETHATTTATPSGSRPTTAVHSLCSRRLTRSPRESNSPAIRSS